MTEAECREVLATCAAYWPHQPMPDAAVLGWLDLLGDQPTAVVRDCVRLHAAEGEQFPPAPGQVLNRIGLATNTLPDWDEVLAEIRAKLKELNRDHRFSSTPYFQFHTPEVHEWSGDEVAGLVHRSGGINAWRESLGSWCGGTDDTTFLAQQRNIYGATRTRSEDHGRINQIGAGSLNELGQPKHIGEMVAAYATDPQTPSKGSA